MTQLKQRTNFYKLPIGELKERIRKLQDWWWDNPNDPRRTEAGRVLRLAYNALQNRRSKDKQIRQAVEVFWEDIPEKYEELSFETKTDHVNPEFARETGLEKVSGGWLFDSQKYRDSKSPSGLV